MTIRGKSESYASCVLLQTLNNEKYLHSANLGASKVVVCRSGKSVDLSGSNEKDYVSYGMLRSFGDSVLSSEPFITSIKLDKSDTHAVLASQSVILSLKFP